MNKHDRVRKDSLIKSLCKSKEQADLVLLYLNANNRDMQDILTVTDALEHIDIALERLGAAVPATF